MWCYTLKENCIGSAVSEKQTDRVLLLLYKDGEIENKLTRKRNEKVKLVFFIIQLAA